MSRKKPTIKELNQIVLENREGINLAFKSIEENRAFVLGIDRLLDWYIEYKEDIDGFKKYIQKNKSEQKSEDSDGAKDSLSDKQQDVPKKSSSKAVSKKTK
tara:strand:- start:818 stop:1120 length:303 start_codon:yes stop_codon:yes gene_type:complete